MRIFILVALLALPGSIFPQKLSLKIDAGNAVKTFQCLSAASVTQQEVEYLQRLPGTIGMLNHDGQFDQQVNKANFAREITDTAAITNAFRFKQIRKDLASIQATIKLMTDSVAEITKRIESNLIPFTNGLDSRAINVYFILGGNSDGYSTDGNSFFLELQFFGEDIAGIINIVTHEIYHIIQQRTGAQSNKIISGLAKTDKTTFVMLHNIYLEGSATYVADPSTIVNPKKYGLFQQEKLKRNLEKVKESFYLFEALLMKANSAGADEDLLYNIGYGGEWDSPLYFVGYVICNKIENKYGRFYIKKYLTASPLQLLLDYIDLYKNTTEIQFRFSAETEKIIFHLQKNLETITDRQKN